MRFIKSIHNAEAISYILASFNLPRSRSIVENSPTPFLDTLIINVLYGEYRCIRENKIALIQYLQKNNISEYTLLSRILVYFPKAFKLLFTLDMLDNAGIKSKNEILLYTIYKSGLTSYRTWRIITLVFKDTHEETNLDHYVDHLQDFFSDRSFYTTIPGTRGKGTRIAIAKDICKKFLELSKKSFYKSNNSLELVSSSSLLKEIF